MAGVENEWPSEHGNSVELAAIPRESKRPSCHRVISQSRQSGSRWEPATRVLDPKMVQLGSIDFTILRARGSCGWRGPVAAASIGKLSEGELMSDRPDLTKLDWQRFGEREESPGRRAYWNGLVLSIYSTTDGKFECYVTRPMRADQDSRAKNVLSTADEAVDWVAEAAAEMDRKWESWEEEYSEALATAERAIERVDKLLSGAA